MKKKYDLAVKIGSYESQGKTKSRYLNIGCVMENDKGLFMLLNKAFNPAGINSDRESIMVSMFEPRPKKQSNTAEQEWE